MPWRYFFGLILLAIGVGCLVLQMSPSANQPATYVHMIAILSWWPMIIVAIGVNQFVRHQEQPWGSLIVFALGFMLLVETQEKLPLSHHSLMLLVSAILIMAVAMRMIVPRPVRKVQTSAPGMSAKVRARFEHCIKDRQIFGSTYFRNESQQFLGGKLAAILGDYELDLRGAALSAKDAELHINSIFGTVRVRVPQQMVLDVAGLPVLAGVENTAQQIVTKADGLPTLKVRYFAFFGSVEIAN